MPRFKKKIVSKEIITKTKLRNILLKMDYWLGRWIPNPGDVVIKVMGLLVVPL